MKRINLIMFIFTLCVIVTLFICSLCFTQPTYELDGEGNLKWSETVQIQKEEIHSKARLLRKWKVLKERLQRNAEERQELLEKKQRLIDLYQIYKNLDNTVEVPE